MFRSKLLQLGDIRRLFESGKKFEIGFESGNSYVFLHGSTSQSPVNTHITQLFIFLFRL